MRLLSAAVCTTVAAALLASCSGNGSSPNSSVVPGGSGSGVSSMGHGAHGLPVNVIAKQFMPKVYKGGFRGKRAPSSALKGIYISEFFGSSVLGYPKNNSANGPAICSESGVGSVNDIATDTKGNLIVPNAFSGVNVYTGPQMCGPLAGTISDTFGQASDAASINAMTSNIAVGNIFDNSGLPGSISVCQLSSLSCSANLTNSNIFEMAGVAMAKNGDCWGNAINSADVAVLVYFAGCAGGGQVATGFNNPFYGGVDIDNQGNLVTTSLFGPSFSLPSQVYVYSGCNPACTLVGGGFPLQGESVFGHVGRQNERYVTADISDGEGEVYSYTGHGTGLSYLYSFNNGLSVSDEPEGAAYSPSSQSK